MRLIRDAITRLGTEESRCCESDSSLSTLWRRPLDTRDETLGSDTEMYEALKAQSLYHLHPSLQS